MPPRPLPHRPALSLRGSLPFLRPGGYPTHPTCPARRVFSTASGSALSILPTSVDPSAPDFLARAKSMAALERDLAALLAKVADGGGAKARERVARSGRGKMMVRQRIEALVDPLSAFVEVGALAAEAVYDFELPAAGIVCGIGTVRGTECMIIANDGQAKGGSYSPLTVKKELRAQEIAAENRLPCVYLVESGGAMLPFQADVFPDKEHFGRIFFNMARMSRDGIPQISVVHGISVAGGAYAGAMGDLNIIVREQGFVGLAGVPLVKASLGEDVDAETLGGAVMHTSVSGVCDQLAESDAHALELTRAAIASLSYKPLLTPSMRAQPDRASEEPLYDPAELGGIVGTNVKQGYEVREVIARVVDGSRLDEWKKGYGETVVTGFAHIHGYPVGVIANQGILFGTSAKKAAHFILLCEQRSIPLIFLTNIAGFMVGSGAERAAIASDGAKLVRAVACTTVPKFSILLGGNYGAGAYAMAGRSYAPRFLWAWPGAHTSVMGADQLSDVMGAVSSDKEGNAKLKAQIERESTAVFSSARLWDDGVIRPADTRSVLGLGLAVAMKSWPGPGREGGGGMGVFRM